MHLKVALPCSDLTAINRYYNIIHLGVIFHNVNDFVIYFPIYNPEDPTTEIKRTKEIRLQTKSKLACLIPSLLIGLNMNQQVQE